jgi:hypothetical protein
VDPHLAAAAAERDPIRGLLVTFHRFHSGDARGGILSVSATTVSGRGSVTITQAPTEANDYTLIAQFTDGFNGSASLHGQITVTTVPEPTTTLLLAAGLALPAFGGRRGRRVLSA